MGRWWRLAGAAAVMLTAWTAEAETIYLKNGRTIVGLIDPAASDDQQVTIRTATATLQIPRSMIERIEQDSRQSRLEIEGDRALAAGELDRARDLYRQALAENPASEPLKRKIETLDERIRNRDEARYGAIFERIEGMLKRQQYEQAAAEASALARQAAEPSVRARARRLIAQAHLQIARRALEFVDYPAAEANFRRAQEADPDNPAAFLELAQMYEQFAAGRRPEAIALYRKSLELEQRDPQSLDPRTRLDVRFRLGQLLMSDKQFEAAAEMFLELARMDRGSAYPQAVSLAVEAYARRIASAQPEDFPRLITALEAVTALDPANERARALLGRLYYERQQWAEARTALAPLATRFAPGVSPPWFEDALFYLGVSQRRLGDVAAAAETLQRLLSSSTANYDALCELGEIRIEQAAYEAAIVLFERAMALDRSRYRAYLGRGTALKRLGRFEDARADLQTVLARDPTNVAAALLIAESYFEQNRMNDVETACRAVLDIIGQPGPEGPSPEHARAMARAYTLIGLANLHQLKPNLAREQFDRALKLQPDSPEALDGMGRAFQAEGAHDRALTYFERAVAAAPTVPDFRLNLAVHHHKYTKNLQAALESYYKYLELGGKDPNVRKWIVECGGTPPPETVVLRTPETPTTPSVPSATGAR